MSTERKDSYADCRTREELVRHAVKHKTLQANVISSEKSDDGIARYTVEVLTGRHRWLAEYRYREWLELENDIKSMQKPRSIFCCCAPSARNYDDDSQVLLGASRSQAFPSKKLMGSQRIGAQNERRLGFDAYITGLLLDTKVSNYSCVVSFLCAGHPSMDAYKDRILDQSDDDS